jgi:hypothetical protein
VQTLSESLIKSQQEGKQLQVELASVKRGGGTEGGKRSAPDTTAAEPETSVAASAEVFVAKVAKTSPA